MTSVITVPVHQEAEHGDPENEKMLSQVWTADVSKNESWEEDLQEAKTPGHGWGTQCALLGG